MKEKIIAIFISILIPVAGGVTYIHTTFATQASVVKIEKKVGAHYSEMGQAIKRIDKLICKMAISQELENAEQICTE